MFRSFNFLVYKKVVFLSDANRLSFGVDSSNAVVRTLTYLLNAFLSYRYNHINEKSLIQQTAFQRKFKDRHIKSHKAALHLNFELLFFNTFEKVIKRGWLTRFTAMVLHQSFRDIVTLCLD